MEKFVGCECLKKIAKKILEDNGFDSILALKQLDDNYLDQLEHGVKQEEQSWQNMIKNINCAHAKIYSEQKKFKFLHGHRIALLKWCNNLNEEKMSSSFDINDPAFSPILKTIIEAALENYNKPANTRRFSKLLMDFSIYIYFMAGKASYEMISANLLLPKPKTISEFIFICSKWFIFISSIFPRAIIPRLIR